MGSSSNGARGGLSSCHLHSLGRAVSSLYVFKKDQEGNTGNGPLGRSPVGRVLRAGPRSPSDNLVGQKRLVARDVLYPLGRSAEPQLAASLYVFNWGTQGNVHLGAPLGEYPLGSSPELRQGRSGYRSGVLSDFCALCASDARGKKFVTPLRRGASLLVCA